MMLTMAYTGMRWSEAAGLPPGCVSDDTVDIDWKLYELDARFYRGRPKDGSIRTADVPPFLAELLAGHLDARPDRRCTCRNTEPPWCPGGEYVFLGRGGRTSAARTTRRESCARRLTAGIWSGRARTRARRRQSLPT